MTRTPVSSFDYSEFTYDKEKKWFIAEISDLVSMPTSMINVQGKRHRIQYQREEIIKDEGDILVWIYRPMAHAQQAVPACVGTEVHILND